MSKGVVRCPKCGSQLVPDDKGRAFCVACGKEYYVCLECLKAGRTDYESFVFSSVRALAGHMRSHRFSKDNRALENAFSIVGAVLSSPMNREAERMLSIAKKLSGCLASTNTECLLVALSLAQLVVLTRIYFKLEEVELLLRTTAPLHLRGEARSNLVVDDEVSASIDLPSFVRGNPWVEVLSGRRG